MELNEKSIYKIFEKNFSFPIVDTIIGKAIKMDPISAFLFSNVTGAGYLDNSTYPFTPKGVMKILRQAFKYNIVTGIFDGQNLFYSPTELISKKDYLFKNEKYVVLIECNSEQEFREETQKYFDILKHNKIETADYIIFRIEAWKNGNGMECFLEYLACEYFRKKGYIVENQIPLVHAVGTPDFGGFKTNDSNHGFHLIELSMLRITKNLDLLNHLKVTHVIVGEAKTSTTIMASQLEKYLKTGVFYKGYEMHPEKRLATKDCFGLLNINDSYLVHVQEPATAYNNCGKNLFDYDEYLSWYENNLKFYILANLTNEELKQFIEEKSPRGKYNQKKIVAVVLLTPINEIIKFVKEAL